MLIRFSVVGSACFCAVLDIPSGCSYILYDWIILLSARISRISMVFLLDRCIILVMIILSEFQEFGL